MNLSDIPKEQQKKILLIMLALILVVGLIALSVLPMLKKRSSVQSELAALRDKIDTANLLSGEHLDSLDKLEGKSARLSTETTNLLPPPENTFVWATEMMYSYTRQSGIEIESINEVSTGKPAWASDPSGNQDDEEAQKPLPRRFVPYRVKIDTHCNYAELLELVSAIEADNKYASINSLSVRGVSETPNEHRVSLTVEWPTQKEDVEYSIEEIIAGQSVDNKKADS